jgi:hypothetical protein
MQREYERGEQRGETLIAKDDVVVVREAAQYPVHQQA